MNLKNIPLYKSLTILEEEANKKMREAERIKKLNDALAYSIQSGEITDYETINIAISWLHHSSLEVEEILEIIKKGA